MHSFSSVYDAKRKLTNSYKTSPFINEIREKSPEMLSRIATIVGNETSEYYDATIKYNKFIEYSQIMIT